MYCPVCGTYNDDGSEFCGSCGTKMGGMPGVAPESTQVRATPTPEPQWPQGSTPSSSYDLLGTDFQTPPTVATEVKKKGHGKLVATLAGMLIVLLAAVFLVTNPVGVLPWDPLVRLPWQQDAPPTTMPAADEDEEEEETTDSMENAPTSATPEEDGEAESSDDEPEATSISSDAPASASAAAEAGEYSFLLGTWTGTMQSDSSVSCYGDDERPFVITFNSVKEANGRVGADFTVLIHAHAKPMTTESSDPDDVYFEVTDATMSMVDNQITYQFEARLSADITANVTLTIDMPDPSFSTSELTVTVNQKVSGAFRSNATRTFAMEKN